MRPTELPATTPLPKGVLAAAVLAAQGVSMLVVGSAARWLHGRETRVGDLDVIVDPSPPNLVVISEALIALGGRQTTPSPHALEWAERANVRTGLGAVDLLLGIGRRDFSEMSERTVGIEVGGETVPVASLDDVETLSARLKEALGP